MDKKSVVIQWNCRSVNSKKSDLFYLINKFQPFAISLQETWLKPDTVFKVPGFVCYREDRSEGYCGAALLVSHSVSSSHIPINNHNPNFQIIAAKVNKYCLVSVYIPHPSSSISDDIINICSSLPKPILIMGDFNAQHESWGSSTSNYYGNRILDLLDIGNLCILNDGSPTRLTPPHEGISCPDLSISSPNLASTLQWETYMSTLGSDHFPILIKFPNQNENHSRKSARLKYRLENGDWTLFKNYIDEKISSLPSISSTNQSLCSEAFANILIEAADNIFPRKYSNYKKIPSPPWWDHECTEAVKNRKTAELNFKADSSDENFNILRSIIQQTRKLFKMKKWEGWQRFCSSISPDIAPSVVWSKIKRFRSAFQEAKPAVMDDLLVDEFLDKLAPPFVPLKPLTIDLPSSTLHNDSILSSPFLLSELKGVLSYVKDSAPGLDGIPYSFLTHLGDSSLLYFLSLVNSAFLSGIIPSSWQSQEIIPILKPKKPSDNPNSYRPIALSSVLLKIAEHLIKNRLEWFIESNGFLANSQYGFRKGRSTMDSLSIFSTDIRIAFSYNKSLLAAFLDISAAYDNVNLQILSNKLQELQVPPILVNFITNILSERSVHVQIDDFHSKSRLIWKGLPQGSVLSPLLYNIYTYDLDHALINHCSLLQYADDLLLYVNGFSEDELCSKLSYSLSKLNDWLDNNGLTLSVPKSSIVLFTRKRVSSPITVYYKNEIIPVKNNAKFLGITLDSKLTGLPHCYNVFAKCERALNILRCLSGVWWGAHPTSLKLLYNALIRSILDYGSFILEPCSKVGLKKLDAIQHKALRLILGAMKSTPINAMQIECVESPLSIRRQLLCDRFLFRAFQFNNHPLYEKLQTLSNCIDTYPYWAHKCNPLLINSFRKFKSFQAPTHRSNYLPIFSVNFECLILSPEIHFDINIKKGDIGARQVFNFTVNNDISLQDCHYIFCDASKSINHSNNYCVGVGIFHMQYNIVQKIKLPPETSIFTGECFGLFKSLEYIVLLKLKKSVIFTDSKSSLLGLSKFPIKDNNIHPLILKCRHLIQTCLLHNLSVSFAWIPSHHNIYGNEKADKLAKAAVDDGDIFYYKNYCFDLIALPKSDFLKSWDENWRSSSQIKGTYYKKIQPYIPIKPWFSIMKFGKQCSSIISRMRLGHTCCPVHLAKLNILSSNICECGTEEGSINHIFFSCPLNDNSSFIESLVSSHIPMPTSITDVLYTNDLNIYNILCKFITMNNIKI